MTEVVLIRALEGLVLLYIAYKARQGAEHLRIIRKHATKPRESFKLSPEQFAAFVQLTGRVPE